MPMMSLRLPLLLVLSAGPVRALLTLSVGPLHAWQQNKSAWQGFLSVKAGGNLSKQSHAAAPLNSTSSLTASPAQSFPSPTAMRAVEREYTAIWELMGHAGAEALPAERQQMHFRRVSTTLWCVMGLTIINLGMYTALAAARNADELTGHCDPSLTTEALETANRSGLLLPMLCALFVGCRLYILATTEGVGEPPSWVKLCMVLASTGVILQFVLVLHLPLAAGWVGNLFRGAKGGEDASTSKETVSEGAAAEHGEAVEVTLAHESPSVKLFQGDSNDVHPVLEDYDFQHNMVHTSYRCFQIASMAFFYLGVFGIILGVATFPAGRTSVSPAVTCTILLSFLYFAVYLSLWLVQAIGGEKKQMNLQAARSACNVVQKAPMLAVLFLTARMRALNLDPPDGMPHLGARISFCAATLSLALEVAAAAYIGYTGSEEKSYYGYYVFKAGPKARACQHTFGSFTYVCLIPAAVGTLALGTSHPISPTTSCVLALGALNLGIGFARSTLFLVQDLTGLDYKMAQDTVVAASVSSGFCPMLCVLFVACRMRALQVSQQLGNPQAWAQDCMYLCVAATVLQCFCCLGLPIFTGKASTVDKDGNVTYELSPMVGAYAVCMVKYMALLFLHGGVLVISASILLITRETAVESVSTHERLQEAIIGLFWFMLVFLIATLASSARVLGLMIKLAIESVDRMLLGTDISVGAAAFSLLDGYVNVDNLVLHNPDKRQWHSPHLMRVDKMLVRVNVIRAIKTLGKQIEISAVELTGVDVRFEKESLGDSSNLKMILDHLESLGHKESKDGDHAAAPKPAVREVTAEEPKPKEDPKDAAKGPEIELNHVKIGNIKAIALLAGKPLAIEVKVEPITDLTDRFKGKERVTVSLIVTVVLRILLGTVMNKASGTMLMQGTAMVGAMAAQGIRSMLHRQQPQHTAEAG